MAGRVVAVTGAGGGIGQEVAVHLASLGAKVALIDRRSDLNAGTERRIVEGGIGEARSFGVDVSDPEAVNGTFEQIEEELGSVTGLVTCAAILTTNVTAEDADFGEFDRAMAVNVKGTFSAARAAFPQMKAAGGGAIVTMSSMAAISTLPRQSVYTATKGAVTTLTRSLALDWARYGIRVNSVAPTFTATPMARNMLADTKSAATILPRIPLGRVAEPHDIATVIAFLLSSDSAMVTGHMLPVDGGWAAGEPTIDI